MYEGNAKISKNMNISDTLNLLPKSPGVYLFYDSEDKVIYIGKAKSLKNRVSQYFQSSKTPSAKTSVMVSKITRIEHTVVDSEEDALLLENNLIKSYQPKYNILLKDNKTYPWIIIKNEPFPRVFLTRRFVKDGSLFFGPYSSVTHAYNLLDLINSLYKLRNCKLSLTNESIALGKFKVCLNYHLGKCKAPCVGFITEAEYIAQIDGVKEILRGNSGELIRGYERKMKEAASNLYFEEAQRYKESKELLEKHYSKSLVVSANITDVDAFSLIFDGSDAFGNFMRVKNGSIVRSQNMEFKMRIEEEEASVLSTFMGEIYASEEMPKEILVPFLPEGEFKNTSVRVPLKGEKLSLLELSRKNAAALKFEKLKREEFVNPTEHTDRILENLKRDLGMEEKPTYIECFDNSNIQGTNPVAACVVFKNALPSKSDYRHFNIRSVVGPNDYASMKEVINRRYSRLLNEGGELPQLIVIDGGKGQVSSAYEAICELGLEKKIKIIGIAERLEELIVPGESYPIFLDKNSTSLRLIMNLRDEAHRFGITHHRNRRSKGQTESLLREIKGIGAKNEEKLIQKFKSISGIKKASYEEVAATIGKRAATSLFSFFGIDL